MPADTTPRSRPSRLAAYADLFERMLDPTFLVDPATSRIIEANAAVERVFSRECTGRTFLEFAPAEGRDDLAKALRMAMRRYHPRLSEVQWDVGGKLLTFEIVACPLALSDKTEVLQVIVRDITFRREAEEKLKVLSTVDEMTGLFNYRYFKTAMAQEHARSHRFENPYAIVFCDIDHFKQYNDNHGHQAGDALLREMAQIIRNHTRSTDLCARYGGEEFVILCPETDGKQGMALGERIRAAVAKHAFKDGATQPNGHLSFSIGVASYPVHGRTPEQVLHAADLAMYQSKDHGRDQVTSAELLKDLKAS